MSQETKDKIRNTIINDVEGQKKRSDNIKKLHKDGVFDKNYFKKGEENIIHNKDVTGENNHSFRNGFYTKQYKEKHKSSTVKHTKACSRYHEYFLEEHDYNYCELCGISNSPRFEVHHIVYASEAPDHEELHNFKNLILLCIGCHNKLHSKKSLRNELVKERGLNELFDRNLIIYK